MISRKITIASIWLSMLVLSVVANAASFVIQDIRVDGLQRISPGTVFNYLPVAVGDRIEDSRSGEIIRALYRTGFFDDVGLQREGNVLVINVKERPAIGRIELSGNDAISKDQLIAALKDIGLAEGRVFNQSVLDKMEQELRRQYFSLGKYAVELESVITPLERNRVAVTLKIEEGKTAKIKRINIIGNEDFSESDLLGKFQLGVPGVLDFFSKKDQYSRPKLAADLETLRSFYLDRGYIQFAIDSTQVSITPNKEEIYVTINLTEGEVFRVGDIKLAGDLKVAADDIYPLIKIKQGDLFSRKDIVATSEQITNLLGNHGYAFANVNSIPEIDEQKKQVKVTFFVDPGKRVYVRRINITGNNNTRDEVLRREMRQLESAWFSTELVSLSRQRLRRLGYFTEVTVETPAVAGSTDQIDVNMTVVEKPAGNLIAGVGFSQSDGVVLNASISQINFLGTGKRVSLAFNNSSSQTEYRVAYNNPYYTIDGISRGFDLRYRSTDFSRVNTADYITDEALVQVNFGVPINEYDRIRFDFSVKNTDFKLGGAPSVEIQNFETVNGDQFLDFILGVSWIHDSRDSAIFPKSGGLQRFTAQASLPGSDLTYYKVGYKNRHYFPLTEDFTLSLNGEVGYGDAYADLDRLPFFENYFAGGIRSVRGFKNFTLGPRDSQDDPLGANMKLVGNLELLFPPPFGGVGDKTVRFGAFVDGGAVFDSNAGGFDAEEIRYSTGLSMVWLSPVGVLGLVFSEPLNAKEGDRTEKFQFTFGSSF